MRTRLQDNIVQPRQFNDGTVLYKKAFNTTIATEPMDHVEALHQPQWTQAMSEEYMALIKNNTWHLTPPRPSIKIIDCKWIFKIKRKTDG